METFFSIGYCSESRPSFRFNMSDKDRTKSDDQSPIVTSTQAVDLGLRKGRTFLIGPGKGHVEGLKKIETFVGQIEGSMLEQSGTDGLGLGRSGTDWDGGRKLVASFVLKLLY